MKAYRKFVLVFHPEKMIYILLFSLTSDNDDLPAEQDTILSVNINYEGEMLGNR